LKKVIGQNMATKGVKGAPSAKRGELWGVDKEFTRGERNLSLLKPIPGGTKIVDKGPRSSQKEVSKVLKSKKLKKSCREAIQLASLWEREWATGIPKSREGRF